MSDVAHYIDLNLVEKLHDRAYRQKFFSAECSAEVAAQLIALRKRRDLDQGEVADLIGTQQPAISRYEKADYLSRSFSILQKIANALDARIRVLIEPSEDVLREYAAEEAAPEAAALREILRPRAPTESEPESKHSPRLATLSDSDEDSAASYRSTPPKQADVPKREALGESAAFH